MVRGKELTAGSKVVALHGSQTRRDNLAVVVSARIAGSRAWPLLGGHSTSPDPLGLHRRVHADRKSVSGTIERTPLASRIRRPRYACGDPGTSHRHITAVGRRGVGIEIVTSDTVDATSFAIARNREGGLDDGHSEYCGIRGVF